MDDWIIYFGLAGVIGLISIILTFLIQKKGCSQVKPEVNENAQQRVGGRARPANQRRVAGGNRRARPNLARDDSDSDVGVPAQHSDGSDIDPEEKAINDPKLGAKKRAKLEAKAEKKVQREAEERVREERKVREAKVLEERLKVELEEAEEEKQKSLEEKRLREEKAQRELEEYNQFKAAFTVEDEGCEAPEDDEEGNLIEKFIEHIKNKKVILFEELATQFGLKVPDAIDRLTKLVEEGRLTGVMDDRGKFIYISMDELTNLAKFVKQRGRVSIQELVENSASLITLTSETSTAVVS